MDFYSARESLECIKCEFITRKIVPSVPLIDKILGRVIKYECNRNCEIKILEELKPKKFIYKLTSHLDLNSNLKGESIYIITTKLKPIKLLLVNKYGCLKASKGIIDAFTFAEIKYPLENVLNSINKRKELEWYFEIQHP